MCPPRKKNNAPHNLDQRGNHKILNKERKKANDELKNSRFENHNNAQQIHEELSQVTQSPTLEQTPTTLPYIILDAKLQKGVVAS
jgi:hypothetical protein